MTEFIENLGNPSLTQGNQQMRYYSINKSYYRHSHKYLTAKQVETIFSAAEKAYYQGMPLNRFFTIHYNDHADPKNPQAFVTDILGHTRKWLQHRGLPVAYAYVIENGKTKGIHAHILIHIPKHYQRDYKQALRRWLPFEWTKKTVTVKPVNYPDYGQLSPLSHIYGVLRYMCKGIDPETPVRGIRPRYQGEISGRRWGTSKPPTQRPEL